MKRMLLAASALIPALSLGACVGDGYYGGGGGYYAGGPVAYDGFYDDYYGPVYDGYWGDDGGFYYRSGAHDRHFRRGDPAHFQHGGPGGPPSGHFHAMQGSFAPARGMSTPHFGGGGMHGGGHGGHH